MRQLVLARKQNDVGSVLSTCITRRCSHPLRALLSPLPLRELTSGLQMSSRRMWPSTIENGATPASCWIGAVWNVRKAEGRIFLPAQRARNQTSRPLQIKAGHPNVHASNSAYMKDRQVGSQRQTRQAFVHLNRATKCRERKSVLI